jgi:hypothetical protein
MLRTVDKRKETLPSQSLLRPRGRAICAARQSFQRRPLLSIPTLNARSANKIVADPECRLKTAARRHKT